MRLFPLLILGLALSGCTSYSLTYVRNDLARQMPDAKIGEGYALTFGRFSIGTARFLAGFAGDDDSDMARLVLRDVRKVQFGHYEVEGPVDGSHLVMPNRLRRFVERDGWTHLATFRDPSEAGWVLYRERRDAITDLFVVVLNDEELVLARLSGDLSGIVHSVMESQQFDLPMFRDEESPEETAEVDALIETVSRMP